MSEGRTLYDLVVVGSSAGGIEALSLLVSTLPTDFPAAARARATPRPRPAQPSRRHPRAPECTASAHRGRGRSAKLLATGTVYVVPADRDVEIIDHAVVLQYAVQRASPSHPLTCCSRAPLTPMASG